MIITHTSVLFNIIVVWLITDTSNDVFSPLKLGYAQTVSSKHYRYSKFDEFYFFIKNILQILQNLFQVILFGNKFFECLEKADVFLVFVSCAEFNELIDEGSVNSSFLHQVQ